MFNQTHDQPRFNLLLLNEREKYLNDYSAIFYPSSYSDQDSVDMYLKIKTLEF